jgi:catechol-2,3-dioxygenase
MLLIGIGVAPRAKGGIEPGLYHIGFKIGDGAEILKQAYTELVAKGVTIIGSADHFITHSLYILDPDGNELELYVDVSDAWKTDPKSILTPTKRISLD